MQIWQKVNGVHSKIDKITTLTNVENTTSNLESLKDNTNFTQDKT